VTSIKKQIEDILDAQERPYRPFRRGLYTVDELMQGYGPGNPDASLDNQIAEYYKRQGEQLPKRFEEALAQRVHDNAIDRAIIRFVKNRGHGSRKMVGIMGSHSASREDDNYIKIAQVARGLTAKGYSVVSGGGPGIMEAANLGAYMASSTTKSLANALVMLAQAPDYN
jgi:hypothetical protein